MPLMHKCRKCGNIFRPLTKFYEVCDRCLPKSALVQLNTKKTERMYAESQRRLNKNGRKQRTDNNRVQGWAFNYDDELSQA